jgi:glutathione S-transferase
MLTLHGTATSGNCYKPRLLLAKLGRPFRHVEVDLVGGQTARPEFLELNPDGKVPVLQFEDGRCLAESNAILFHLGEGTRFVLADAFERALVMQWLFFEQYSHEPTIAVRRALSVYPHRRAQATPERMASLLVSGNRALAVMERQLGKTPFMVGDAVSIADIALYAYTHDAAAGGFDIAAFPAVSAWLARVAADPDHVPIDWLP